MSRATNGKVKRKKEKSTQPNELKSPSTYLSTHLSTGICLPVYLYYNKLIIGNELLLV